MRNHRIALALGSVTLVAVGALAGCSGGASEEVGDTSGSAEEPLVQEETLHSSGIMRTHRPGQARKAGPLASASDLTYRGGPLLQNAKVYTVFWRASIANQDQLGTFFGDVGQSSYVDWLSEYDVAGKSIHRATFAGKVIDPSPPASSKITNDQIKAELERLISQGIAPAPDDDSLYMIYFPPGVTITLDTATSCVQFCAYHFTYTRPNGQNVMYGVMPDLSAPGCATGCGNNPTVLDNLTEVSSHEWIEATTDPAVGIDVLSWYNDSLGEIGDICVGRGGKVGNWTVQAEWSNAAGACVVTREVGDGGTDSGSDSGSDAGQDSGTDAGEDGGTDAGEDGGTDAGEDSGTDAGTCGGPSEQEPNDLPQDATPLEGAVCGSLDPSGDRDTFSFTVAKHQQYDIVLDATGDAELRLYIKKGTRYVRVQSTSSTEVSHRSTLGGDYVALVRSPSSKVQAYTISSK